MSAQKRLQVCGTETGEERIFCLEERKSEKVRLQKTRPLSHLKLTIQSGKSMTKRTERSTIVMGETTENMGTGQL